MGLVRTVGRTAVIAGTATSVSNRVSRRQAGRWAEQEQAAQQAPPAQDATPAAGEPAYMAELQQLAALRDQGILTDEEFEAKKRRLLGI